MAVTDLVNGESLNFQLVGKNEGKRNSRESSSNYGDTILSYCVPFLFILLFLIGFFLLLGLVVSQKGIRSRRTFSLYNRDWSTSQNSSSTITLEDHSPLYPEIFMESPSKLNLGCKGNICEKAAREIKSSLNTSVDPCDNFYDFACQGWLEKNPVPGFMTDWSVFGKLENETLYTVIEIFKDPTTMLSDIKGVRQASQYFNLCMNVDKYEDDFDQYNSTLQTLIDTLEEYGGWPMLYEEGTWNSSNFDLTKFLVDLRRKFNSKPVLDIIPVHRTLNLEIFSFEIEEDKGLKSIDAYKEFIVNITREILEYMGSSYDNETYLEIQALNIILIQNQIVESKAKKNFKLDLFSSENNVGNLTLVELQALLDLHVFPHENKLDLLGIITQFFANVNIHINGSESLSFWDVNYLLNLAEVFSKTDEEALVNYLHFQMVLKMVPFVTSKTLREILENFKMLMDGTTEIVPRQNFCALLVQKYFAVALGYQYVLLKYNGHEKESSKEITEARKMFNNIKYEYNDLLDTSFQIDYFDKNLLKDKLERMDLCVGRPSWINDKYALQYEYSEVFLSLQGNLLEQTISLNAWFMDEKLKTFRKPGSGKCKWDRFVGSVVPYIDEGKVYLLQGILQPPFLSTGLPKSIVYGKLGSIVGHELAHGLVGTGWTTKKDGSLTKMSECLKRYYNNSTCDEVKDINVTLDGNMTLEENVADNAGLLAAYKAYLTDETDEYTQYGFWVNLQEERTKGLEEYTDRQLFYIGFAQNWCKLSTAKSMHRSLANDEHTPGRFRVLKALQNSEEFATAWNCPVGTKMNPRQTTIKNKCKLF